MKSCISNIFFNYGDAHLTLFLKLRNFLNNRKSLMTLMTVTLMTGFRYWKMKMTDNEFDTS